MHEQGQTPDSLKRSYENAQLGQQWLKYTVLLLPENGLFPPFLLIARFGDFRKLVSNRGLPSGFREESSGGMKRLFAILLLVFSVGVPNLIGKPI